MGAKKKSPALAGPGRSVCISGQYVRQFTPSLRPWRQWASAADAARLTARQRVAVSLIQSGVADSPEHALALLEGAA